MAFRNTAQYNVFMLIVFSILACHGVEHKSLPTAPGLELQTENKEKLGTMAIVMADTDEERHSGRTAMRWSPATTQSWIDLGTDSLHRGRKQTPARHAAGPPRNISDSNGLPLDRKRRYATAGGKWPKHSLTYYIQNFTSQISRKQTQLAIRTGFDAWQRESSTLRFTEIFNNKADMTLLFTTGDHGDEGVSTQVIPGHAYYPDSGGNVHFNDKVSWTVGANGTFDLAIVAAHEVGHALGLGHTRDKGNIMYYFYHEMTTYPPRLGQDDIDGIRALYGEPLAEDTQTGTPHTLVITGVVAGCGSFVLILIVINIVAIRRKQQRSRIYEANNSADELQNRNAPKSPVPSGASIYLHVSEIQNQRTGTLPHNTHRYPYIPENNRSGNQVFQRTTSSLTDAPYEQIKFDQASEHGSYCEILDNITDEFSYDDVVTHREQGNEDILQRSVSDKTYETSMSQRETLREGAEGNIQVLSQIENEQNPSFPSSNIV